jgi:hypothetical protein
LKHHILVCGGPYNESFSLWRKKMFHGISILLIVTRLKEQWKYIQYALLISTIWPPWW